MLADNAACSDFGFRGSLPGDFLHTLFSHTDEAKTPVLVSTLQENPAKSD